MAFRHLTSVVLIAAAVALNLFMGRAVGPWQAFALWTIAIGFCCGVSAWLIKTAELNAITWKNRVGGLFIRWGFVIGKGKLPPIVIVSYLVWLLVGLSVALISIRTATPLRPLSDFTIPTSSPTTDVIIQIAPPLPEPAFFTHTVLMTLMLASWISAGGLMLYLLGIHVKNYLPTASGNQSVRTILGILLVMLVGSAALWFAGYPFLAILLCGGPIFIVGGAYGLFVVILLIVGRNVRWN